MLATTGIYDFLQGQNQTVILLTSMPELLVVKHTHSTGGTEDQSKSQVVSKGLRSAKNLSNSFQSLKSMVTLHLAQLCSETVTPVQFGPTTKRATPVRDGHGNLT